VDPNRIQATLRPWCDDVLTGYPDRLVPLPPDARIEIVLIGPIEILTQTINDVQAPDFIELQRCELRFKFRRDESEGTMNGLPWYLREAVKRDQTLGGRVDRAYVDLDEADPEDQQRISPQVTADGYELCVPITIEADRIKE
jgi:hypothetical protein